MRSNLIRRVQTWTKLSLSNWKAHLNTLSQLFLFVMTHFWRDFQHRSKKNWHQNLFRIFFFGEGEKKERKKIETRWWRCCDASSTNKINFLPPFRSWRLRTRQQPHQGTLTERERLSTVDLLVLTSLDQLLLTLKLIFTFLQNELPQRGGQLYLPLQLVFPGHTRLRRRGRGGRSGGGE